MKTPIKAATIYSSGKVCLLGGKSRKDLEDAIQILEKDLIKFKREPRA